MKMRGMFKDLSIYKTILLQTELIIVNHVTKTDCSLTKFKVNTSHKRIVTKWIKLLFLYKEQKII